MIAYSEGGEGKTNFGWPLTSGTVAGWSIKADGAEARLRTILSFLVFPFGGSIGFLPPQVAEVVGEGSWDGRLEARLT